MDSVLSNYIFHKITQLFHTLTIQNMYTSIKYNCTRDWQRAPKFYDNREFAVSANGHYYIPK